MKIAQICSALLHGEAVSNLALSNDKIFKEAGFSSGIAVDQFSEYDGVPVLGFGDYYKRDIFGRLNRFMRMNRKLYWMKLYLSARKKHVKGSAKELIDNADLRIWHYGAWYNLLMQFRPHDIFFYHGIVYPYLSGISDYGVRSYYQLNWLRSMDPHIIVHSEFMKNDLVKQGFDPNSFSLVPAFQRYKLPYQKRDASKARLLAYGRYAKNKAIPELAKACKESKLALTAFGDNYKLFEFSQQYKEAKQYENESIKLFGKQPEIESFFNNANIYVCNSYHEGFNVPCLPPDELIITSDGLKKISEIKEGDYVLTHKGRFKKVMKTMKRNYKGTLYGIKVSGYYKPIFFTPEHPIYAFKQPKKGKKGRRTYTLQEANWIEAKALKKGDCTVFPIPQKQFSYITENSSALAELIGWYIAEGTAKINTGIIYSLNSLKEKEVADHLGKLINELFGIKYNIVEHNKSHTLYLYANSWILGAIFPKLCGHRAENKNIPKTILYGDNKILEVALASMVSGDGYRGNKIIQYSTVSEQLAHDTMIAALRLGKMAQIQRFERKEYIFGGKKYKSLPEFTINYDINYNPILKGRRSWFLPDQQVARLIDEVITKEYNGKVYNLEVEEDNSYCTGAFAVHNCIESEAHSLPILTRRGTAMDDLVKEGYNGYLFDDVSEIPDLADKILKNYSKMSYNAWKHAQGYTYEIYKEKLLKVIDKNKHKD